MSVTSERLVRGVVALPVETKRNEYIRLQPVFSGMSGRDSSEVALVPEPFERLNTFSDVYGWTEHALQEMDRLGIHFSGRLIGPVLLPSERDSRNMVQVWLAPDYTSEYEKYVVKTVSMVVENLMSDSSYRMLNRDDRSFLAYHHPSSLNSFWDEQAADSAYYRLVTRVGEGS